MTSTLPVGPDDVAAVAVALPLLATVNYAIRVYERRHTRKNLQSDDWCLGVSLALLWCLAIVCYVGVGIGALGGHSPPPNRKTIPGGTVARGNADFNIEKIVRAFSIVEKLAYVTFKISVLLSYKRIFFAQPIVPKICVGFIILLVCQTVAFIVAAALQCTIRNWGIWWESETLKAHCAAAGLVWLSYSIIDVLTDLILLCIPMPFIVSLQLKRSKKITIIIMFSLGMLSTAVGVARMAYLIDFTFSSHKGYRDLLGLQTDVLLLSLIEASTAIFASSLPAIRSIIVHWKRSKRQSGASLDYGSESTFGAYSTSKTGVGEGCDGIAFEEKNREINGIAREVEP